ncbi:MAG: UDP-N-acetylmuramoyl-L-alanine--D-glutamate ligase [Spirochaetaceae bacterium]|nr:UDP-N-acetylmuramoyl-L-alanine--D-glutamate ligase [Spirochaetaceae bacterium]
MGKVDYSGQKVLVMGLGLHGGGIESARFLALRGAEVTVTDLRDEETLAPSIDKLRYPGGAPLPIRYVLGHHETADFESADLVIKNPGVRPDSPFLQNCRRIETDISIFLAENPARLTAVTGSKGKSGTASAIHWALCRARDGALLPGTAWLGGNITVSPLGFLDKLGPEDDVVLELSSWQLGDLRGRRRAGTAGALLKPRCAVITAILPDHLDRYGDMDTYVADKRVIYQGQDRGDVTIAGDDSWGRSFRRETPGRPLVYAEAPLPEGLAGGWFCTRRSHDGWDSPGFARLAGTGDPVEVVPPKLRCPGDHQKKNFLAAALALLDMGLPPASIRTYLGDFPGIEHRLEFFHEKGGIRFYNDTAATIPEAAAAAVEAFDTGVILVTGGADKNLDFSLLLPAAAKTKGLVLLAGTGSDKLRRLLDAGGLSYRGPFDSTDTAIRAALELAKPGDSVVLSPGCASFGMFLNEFDRGRRWKEGVIRLTGGTDFPGNTTPPES